MISAAAFTLQGKGAALSGRLRLVYLCKIGPGHVGEEASVAGEGAGRPESVSTQRRVSLC